MSDKKIRPRSPFVAIWFIFDVVVSLLPPIHWIITAKSPWIGGIPIGLIYMGGMPICIAASIIFAYRDDVSRGAFS